MAKVKVKGIENLVNKTKAAFKEVVSKDDVFVEISSFAIDRIQKYARTQKRMIQGGEDKAPTPSLSPGYKKFRKTLKPGQTASSKKGIVFPSGPIDEFFRPNASKSQLTFSGQLLKSLTGRILRGVSSGKLLLEFKGNRKEGGTNSNVYKELTDRNSDYEILALSKKAIERINTLVLNKLRRELVKKKLK